MGKSVASLNSPSSVVVVVVRGIGGGLLPAFGGGGGGCMPIPVVALLFALAAAVLATEEAEERGSSVSGSDTEVEAALDNNNTEAAWGTREPTGRNETGEAAEETEDEDGEAAVAGAFALEGLVVEFLLSSVVPDCCRPIMLGLFPPVFLSRTPANRASALSTNCGALE